ncbi:MAG: Ig-like domain-containing protein, partial [Planctomycetota bacterium]
HGTAVYDGDGTFTYFPAGGFSGEDRFTYTLSDGQGGTDVADVIVIVLGGPAGDVVAADDAVSTDQNTPVTTADVRANDLAAPGAALWISGFTQPGHGTVSHNGDGTFTYTPAADYAGTDAFTYTVSDGSGGRDAASVRVVVMPVVGDVTAVAVPDGNGRLAVLCYVDADGTAVRVELRGGGSMEGRFAGRNVQHDSAPGSVSVTGDGLGLRQLVLTGTTAKSSLTIKTDRGGDGLADVAGIAADGPIKALAAKTCRLSGVIAIGPRQAADTRTAAKIALGPTADATLTSLTPIKTLTVAEWLDLDGSPDVVSAPWVGKLVAKGNGRTAAAGHFQADLLLNGAAAPKRTLGSVKIAGNLTARSWDVTGGIGKMVVSGTVMGPAGLRCTIRSTGSMAAVTFGAVRNTDVLAGVDRGIASHAQAAEDFANPLAAIKAVKIKGLKGSAERFFAATTLSAGAIGTVSLLNADFEAGESGLFALVHSGGFGKVRHSDRATGQKWSWPVRPGDVFAGPAGLIHLL